MKSIKDYAEYKNISYEAVRKQVVRYRDELEGHIHVQNRTQYLDEYAEQFLDEKRAANPVIIVQESKDEKIQELSDRVEQYLLKIAELQDKIINRDEEIMRLKDSLTDATIEITQLKGLLEVKKEEGDQKESENTEVAEVEQELEQIPEEVEQEQQEPGTAEVKMQLQYETTEQAKPRKKWWLFWK